MMLMMLFVTVPDPDFEIRLGVGWGVGGGGSSRPFDKGREGLVSQKIFFSLSGLSLV